MENATMTAKACDDERGHLLRRGAALSARSERYALSTALALLSCCAVILSIGTAQAGSRGIGVGIGVGTGLQILNELSKGTKANKSSAKKRTATGSNKKTTKKAKQQRDSGSEAKTTSKSKDTSEQPKVEETAEQPAAAPVAAAIAAPTVTGAVPMVTGPESNLISTKEEVTSAQEHLRYLGYDVPAMTGVLDINTKIAIMKFQDSIGAQATGGLTVDQLQRLYAIADEQQKRAK